MEGIAKEDLLINTLNGKPYSKNYKSILSQRRQLPIYKQRSEFLNLIHNNQILVLVGETGSGKTTQVPQFVLFDDASTKEGQIIACTQPRRVAATSVARRVAEEMDVTLGEQVGYSIRFEDCTSSSTVLKYMTDGMLLREAMSDPLLSRYSTIILDEAHDRTLSTDILMGLIKEICVKRKELKVVVMSATLDAAKFQTYFNDAPLLSVPGRTYDVDIFYSKEKEEDYLAASIRTALQIHECEGEGDILLFLTGEAEIEEACAAIRMEGDLMYNSRKKNLGRLTVLPLYSTLTPQNQQKIFEAAAVQADGLKCRKIIVSTNIAETSLTIDGIVFVIDPGLSKQKVYDARMRVESLLVSPISKASAKQRSGRAGRTRAGKCYRLYTENTFHNDLKLTSDPEIRRSNLSSTILQMKKIGIEDLIHFDFMDSPDPEILMRALELLHYLGALDQFGNLTKIGRQLSEFPIDPQHAKTIIESQKLNCSREVLSIISMMNIPNPFVRPRNDQKKADAAKAQFEDDRSDHMTLLNAYLKFKENESDTQWGYKNYISDRSLRQADNVRNQLERCLYKIVGKVKESPAGEDATHTNVRKALACGFFMQIARLDKSGNYTVTKNDQVVPLLTLGC